MIQGKLNSALFKLALILFFALALRVIFFHGIAPGDPFTYSLSAWDIVQGQWNPAYFYEQTTRWGLLFPLAASYRLFGVNEFSSMLWPLLTSLGTVAVAYLLALHLKGERAAILAGIIVATFPLEIIYATQPMADCPLSFWLLLSLYLFLRADRSDAIRIKRWLFFASGIALALAYSTKFVALLVAPFFLLVLLLRRRIEWPWAWLALGFALVFAIEFVIFQQVTGNGFARLELVLHDNASHAPITAGGFQVQHSPGLYFYWMFVDFHYVGLSFLALLLLLLHRIAKYWRTIDLKEKNFVGVTRSVWSAGSSYRFGRSSETAEKAVRTSRTPNASRDEEMLENCKQTILGDNWMPLLWALTFLLVLSFYPTSMKPYIPLYKIEAYMLMFSAPLLTLTAVLLSDYAKKWQWSVIALIVLSSLPFVYLLQASYRAHSDNARAIFAFSQAHRDRPLYAHRSDQRLLQYFTGFQHNAAYQNFRLPKPDEDVHPTPPINFQHTYIAVNQSMLAYHREDSYPPEITHPPPHWREVYRYQRPEHWLRRMVAAITNRLSPNLAQPINRKFANWSHTQPVIIYATD